MKNKIALTNYPPLRLLLMALLLATFVSPALAETARLPSVTPSAYTVVATVAVGSSPAGVDVNSTTNRVYVANHFSNSVSVIDGVGNTVVATVGVGTNPWGVSINPTTNRIYVANNSSASISVIDGANNTVIATLPVDQFPTHIAANPATNRIYVVHKTYPGVVTVIDGANNTVIATIMDEPSLTISIGVGVNPVTNRIYVANQDYTVRVIDGASNTLIGSIDMGGQPSGIGINPNTNRIYALVCCNRIGVIDGATGAVVTEITVGDRPEFVGVNPTTNFIFVSNKNGDNLSVIDGTSNTVVRTVDVGDQPWGVGVNPSTNRVYVANFNASTVSVIAEAASGYASEPVAGTPLDIGAVKVGAPVTALLTIHETGAAPLNVTSHSLSGPDAADFDVSPATLSIPNGGAAQSLSIRCTPGSPGLRTATLTVNHDAPASPATYTLNCTGQMTVYLPLVTRTNPGIGYR